jgi:hypothetical protein
MYSRPGSFKQRFFYILTLFNPFFNNNLSPTKFSRSSPFGRAKPRGVINS